MTIPTRYLSLLSTAMLVACGTIKPENQTAVELELDGPIRSQYHHLAENPYGEGLLHAGFIVGIKKTRRELLGVPERETGHEHAGSPDYTIF